MDDVSLSDVISEISDELLTSEAKRIEEGRPALFLADSVDIEMSFVVTRSRTGSGGVDLRVVRAEGTKQYDEQQIHRVTAHLAGAIVAEPEEQSEGSTPAFKSVLRGGLMPVRPRRKLGDG